MARILVVDDDQFFRKTVTKFLKTENYELLEAENAEEALDKFDDSIDLIITDLVMPGVNGIELIERIRENSKVKILAMSGYGMFSPKPLQNAVKLAVDATYAKGDDLEKLIKIVEDLLNSTDTGSG